MIEHEKRIREELDIAEAEDRLFADVRTKDIRTLLADLDEARAALSAAKAGRWQPIETAPKDECIVIYQPRFKRVTTAINDGFDWVHATHWQPLPAPPAQK